MWFPPGTWTDYFTGRSYTGPGTQTVTTDLSTMPVFVRGGGIVPTRTDYVDNATKSPLSQVTLDVAAGGSGGTSLYEDAGEGNGYQSGQSTTTAINYTETAGAQQLRSTRRAAATPERSPTEHGRPDSTTPPTPPR